MNKLMDLRVSVTVNSSSSQCEAMLCETIRHVDVGIRQMIDLLTRQCFQ